jgi:perosamine synthetase
MNGPKPLSAGEGGFVLTDDDDTCYRALLHGQYNKRRKGEIPKDHALYRYAVTGMGLKHRIHPLAASIALDQLYHLDDYIEGRQRVARVITEGLEDVPGVSVVTPDDACISSWYGLILQYRPEELGGLPIERYFEAVQAEGCLEADRPGSTCPPNLLPLFQEPGPVPRVCRRARLWAGRLPKGQGIPRALDKAAGLAPGGRPATRRAVCRSLPQGQRKVSASYRTLLG